MKCTVCNHQQLIEIDQAILSGEFTLAALSQKFGPSPSALQRHKGHLKDKMLQSRRRLQEIQEQGSLLLLNALLEHVKKGVETAEAEGNLTGVFRGSYIGSRIIHQLNRMEGSMSLDTLHRLLTSPAWVPQGSLMPTDPKLITELHQALVDGVSLSCPEPLTLISNDDADEDEVGAAAADDAEETAGRDAADSFLDNSKLKIAVNETENDTQKTANGLLIRELQKLLPDLDLTLADLPPRSETEAKNQREISEKSAKNNPACTNKSLQYHKDKPSEKKLPKNPSVGRDPKGGASQNEAHPAVLENEVHAALPENEAPAAVLESEAHPAVLESAAPLVSLTPDHCLSDPCPLAPDPCLSEPAPPVSEEPGLHDYTGNDLFLMTHGYPRDNPPKHIPNRRLDEDSTGFQLVPGNQKILLTCYFSLFIFYVLIFFAICSLFFIFLPFAIRYSLFLAIRSSLFIFLLFSIRYSLFAVF